MSKKKLGNLMVSFLIIINLILWLILPPQNDGRENFTYQFVAEMFSTSGLILFACGIFLSTRPRFLEPYFGGLDKMYQTHRKCAITGFIFIFIHYSLVVISRGIHFNISLGKIAFLGLLIPIFFALVPRLPLLSKAIKLEYHHWRLSHKFTGLFFIVGILHSFRVQNVLQGSAVVQTYVLILVFAGVVIYLYKELLEGLIKKKYLYTVEQVRHLNKNTIEIILKPTKDKLIYQAGQFLFISFPKVKNLEEAHPFTISSAPRNDNLQLTIKVCGDYTSRLYENLQVGAEAHITGGYGMFTYKSGNTQQIWIAGGIGLTPFLSWIRDFGDTLQHSIDFYYVVRNPEDALFLDEIEAAQSQHPSFRFHLHCSSSDGRFSADQITQTSGSVPGKEVYLCGPLEMIRSLRQQLIKAGVPAHRIHYEEFSLR